jgi:hypothetical protein
LKIAGAHVHEWRLEHHADRVRVSLFERQTECLAAKLLVEHRAMHAPRALAYEKGSGEAPGARELATERRADARWLTRRR